MSVLEAVVTYFLVWWLVLFITLPFGIEPIDNPVPGHMHGAPKHHGLKKKIMVTSVASLIVLLVIYIFLKLEFIDFYEFARQMAEEDRRS